MKYRLKFKKLTVKIVKKIRNSNNKLKMKFYWIKLHKKRMYVDQHARHVIYFDKIILF